LFPFIPAILCSFNLARNKMKKKAKNGLTKDQKDTLTDAKKLLRKAKSDPDFAEAMAEHAYDEASWDHFEELITTAETLARARGEAEAIKLGATNTVEEKRGEAWQPAQRLMNICYTLFDKQTELLGRLGLHGSRRDDNGSYHPDISRDTALDILIPWMQNLFDVAQTYPEISSVLAKNGFPPAQLAAGAAAVTALIEARAFQEEASLNRTKACLKRDGAFKILLKWLRCAQRTEADIEKEARREMEAGLVLSTEQ
jgi:hypothetical protein